MSKRTRDQNDSSLLTNTVPKQHAVPAAPSRKPFVPSGCQACALQVPSFFCNSNCDGDGGLIVAKESATLPQQPSQHQASGWSSTNNAAHYTYSNPSFPSAPISDAMSPSNTSTSSTVDSPSLHSYATPLQDMDSYVPYNSPMHHTTCSLCGLGHDPCVSLCSTAANDLATNYNLGANFASS